MVKHKSTLAPFECQHCGRIWYGFGRSLHAKEIILCMRCYCVLHDYIYYEKYDDVLQSLKRFDEIPVELHIEIQNSERTWIANKENKPFPLPVEKKFDTTIPKWMRSAIDAGMVKPNDRNVYVVYSENQHAVKVEVFESAFHEVEERMRQKHRRHESKQS